MLTDSWRARGAARRCLSGAVLSVASLGVAACSEPATVHGDPAAARDRVVTLINAAGAALPSTDGFAPIGRDSTGPVTCRKKFLGYAVGSTGARRSEGVAIVHLPKDRYDPATWTLADARGSLAPVEASWRAAHYAIDRSDFANTRFPKIRARVDGYVVIATGWKDTPQITFYAVSPCVAR